MTSVAGVRMWGRTIGAVSMAASGRHAIFQYDPSFAKSGIEVSPVTMPLRQQPYSFPELSARTFHGLPGLLADSLPDKFGNALIDAWLQASGHAPSDFNAIDRLSYIGTRGMGALEFHPASGPRPSAREIQIADLAELATRVLTERESFVVSLSKSRVSSSMRDILRIGTSAGGARAKAIIAWNPSTNEVRSGQIDAGSSFEHWLLKFDGVKGNKDREQSDPAGFGAVEYAYSLMGRAAGIEMSECRLFEENGRRHFMTRRFDRLPDGGKLHMQSLGALAHYDLNMARVNSYEQAFGIMRQLDLPATAREELFRRMVFNVVARNQDDHVKNIAFLMDKGGRWSLAPAFDLIWAYNPEGLWTGRHQMSINGKFDGFVPEDFRECARGASLGRNFANGCLAATLEVVGRWPRFAEEARVDKGLTDAIAETHRLKFAAD